MQHVSSLICGMSCTFSISNDGDLYSVGSNTGNKLGHFNKENINHFTKIPNYQNIKMIRCGEYHSICLDLDGNVSLFGDINHTFYSSKQVKPSIISFPCVISQISCGNKFSAFLSIDNNIYTLGDNAKGQLGIGLDIKKTSSPILISDLHNIELIECGGRHVICKTFEDNHYVWGDNNNGQLGLKDVKLHYKPIICNSWPNDIISIKCGSEFSLLLTSNGKLYSFGTNGSGQLGIGNNYDKINIPTLVNNIPLVKKISCGSHHSMFIDIDNSFWICGSSLYSQLGLGDMEKSYVFIKHESLSDIVDMSYGGWHTFVKSETNEIYAFGDNDNCQLGLPKTTLKYPHPIIVLQDKEHLWCSNYGKSRQKSARK